MERTENRQLLDIIIMVLLFAMAIGLHNYYITYFMQEVTDVHSLIQNSEIGNGGISGLNYLPHMAASVYRYLLSFLFYIVGNKLLAAVVLQAFLKLLGLFILYFGLRMSIGRLGAFLSVAAMMFFPMGYTALFDVNPVFLAMLLCGVQFLFLGALLQGNRKNCFYKFGWFIVFILYGILCGAAAFLDITGAAVWLVSLVWILCVDRGDDHEGFQNGYLQAVCIFLGGMIAIVGIGCFVSANFGLSFETPYLDYINHLLEVVKENPMEYLYAGIIFGAIVIGGLVQLVYKCLISVKRKETEKVEEEPMIDLNQAAEKSAEQAALEEELAKTRPLDNPLPLPKKHERQKMDYVRQPSKDEMDFDINIIKDEDDFDI